MEIFDEDKSILRKIWEEAVPRQQAKHVISTAIGNVTQLTIKEAMDICDELDRLLLPDEDDDKNKTNPGL